MTTKSKTILSISFLIIGLAFVCLFYLGVLKGIEYLAKIPNISIFIPVVVAIISVFLTKYFEKLKTIEDQQRNKKIVVYERFINYLYYTANSSNLGSVLVNPKITYGDISKDLVLWGSDKLIKKYNEFNQSINYYFMQQKDGNDNDSMLIHSRELLSELLTLVRKDLGFKDEDIKSEDLLDILLLPTSREDIINE